jgi:uncharacterized protein with FMN-binding domain
MHPRLIRTALAGLALGAITTACASGSDTTTSPSTPVSAPPASSTATPTTTRANPTTTGGDNDEYRDGLYQATGWYGGLPSSITVEVTLVDDVITAVAVTPHATDPTCSTTSSVSPTPCPAS